MLYGRSVWAAFVLGCQDLPVSQVGVTLTPFDLRRIMRSLNTLVNVQVEIF